MESIQLISVIVACYNVEKYLSRCIESILSQTYKNIEIILVDDGSVDNTASICDSYASRYPNIRVVHQENKGQSVAKNVGLDLVKGEYLTFVDSDDTISTRYIEFLYNSLQKAKAEVAISTFKLVFEPYDIESLEYDMDKVVEMSGEESVEAMFYQDKFDTTAHCKLYKSELFDGIRCPVGVSYDDLPTIYRVLMRAKKVVYSNYPSYNYLVRNNSIEGSSFSEQKYQSMVSIVSQLEGDSLLDGVRKATNCRIFSFIIRVFLSMPADHVERGKVWAKIKRLRWGVLFDANSRRKVKIAVVLSFLGVPLLTWIYKKNKVR